MGLNLREAVANLADLPQVPGRLQSVSEGRAFSVFVDYAHTPDALENALTTLAELDHRRIILVFGCGGNRDVPKRAQMGEVADRLANYTIITSDNPRDEDPDEIIRGIESGFQGEQFESEPDRRKAIGLGVSYLAPRDILLIAGKGHEDYQIFADETIHFDDCEVARQMLNDRDRARQDMVWEMRREEEKRKLERESRQGRDRDDFDQRGGRS
jgi:UDP-N-acetylmuramoyl-L-alanyl-D-glutamate--2,6-diaminopimelate ligase